jgi:hypothetical protein
MALTVDDINALIDGGNKLVGFTQSVSDLSRNPSGADQLAALLGMTGAISGVVGGHGSPFLQALSAGVGIQAGALGVSVGVVQLTTAYQAFTQAMQTGDEAARGAAQQELADKAIGLFTAVGGTLAAVPVPQVKAVGLAMWLGGTAAQQLMNGNAQRAVDMLGPQITEAIADLTGGASAVVRQYDMGSGEIVTVENRDRYGISEGERGLLTGTARVSVLTSDGRLVTEYRNGSDTPTDQWFEEHATKVSETTLNLPGAAPGWSDLPSGPADDGAFEGNTVDFALELLAPFEFDYADLAGLLDPGSLSAIYANGMEWFSHDGQWYEGYGEWADSAADAELLRMQQTEKELGPGKDADERESRVAGGIASPIAVDLNGDGVHTAGFVHHDVAFDITGDGAAERTAWLSPDDAFVVHDVDRDGVVDGAAELFGGAERGEGYAELAAFDSNRDGRVSSRDDAFASLSLWQDRNSDGQTDAGELRSLGDAGVDDLALSYVNRDQWEAGNLIGEVSQAKVHGLRREMADVYFLHTASSVRPMTPSPLDASVEQLVNAMASFGADAGVPGSTFRPQERYEPFPSLVVGA